MLNKRREWIQGTVLLCFASNMNKILLDLDDIQTKLENKCSELNPVEVPKNSFYYFFLLKSLFLSFFFLNYKLCWLIWKINRKMNDSFYIELFMSYMVNIFLDLFMKYWSCWCFIQSNWIINHFPDWQFFPSELARKCVFICILVVITSPHI